MDGASGWLFNRLGFGRPGSPPYGCRKLSRSYPRPHCTTSSNHSYKPSTGPHRCGNGVSKLDSFGECRKWRRNCPPHRWRKRCCSAKPNNSLSRSERFSRSFQAGTERTISYIGGSTTFRNSVSFRFCVRFLLRVFVAEAASLTQTFIAVCPAF